MLPKTNTLGRLLGVGFLASAMSLIAGCGSNDDLDLSQLALAVEDTSVNVTSGEPLFLWTRSSAAEIYCVRAPCPAYTMSDVNLARNELTYAIDWRALQLTPEQQNALTNNASKLLLFGRYALAQAHGEQVKVFQATRANQRVSEQSIDNPDLDRYYTVHASRESCEQPPCETLSAALMNRQEQEQWNGVDLSRLGLTPAGQQQLLSELRTGTAYPSAREVNPPSVVLTEVFRPYDAQPLP